MRPLDQGTSSAIGVLNFGCNIAGVGLQNIDSARAGTLQVDYAVRPLTFVHGHAQVGRTECAEDQEQNRLTQEQLVEVSGYSQQYISGLEKGGRNPILAIYRLTGIGPCVRHMDIVRPDREA